MGLETGTYVADLVTTNPINSDLESQGAAHLRLIKTVLQNTFPSAGRAVGIPHTVAKSADFTIAAADAQAVYLIDTTAAIVHMTLPTLASGDAGWEVSLIKTNTGTNPVLVTPPSGTIQSGSIAGLAATRRCVPGVRSRVLWTGTAFIAERAVHSPVGTVLEFDGTTLPVGYEWANGQTLGTAATNYPDYSAIIGSGVTLSRRGNAAFGKGNMGGAADAALITVAGGNFDGTSFGATGGVQSVTLAQNQLPNIVPTFTGNVLAAHSHTPSGGGTFAVFVSGAGQLGGSGITVQGISATSSDSAGTPSGTISSINGNVTQQKIATLSPAIIKNFILVVE